MSLFIMISFVALANYRLTCIVRSVDKSIELVLFDLVMLECAMWSIHDLRESSGLADQCFRLDVPCILI